MGTTERHTHTQVTLRDLTSITPLFLLLSFFCLSLEKYVFAASFVSPNAKLLYCNHGLFSVPGIYCAVNIHYHFLFAAIIRLLTAIVLWRTTAKPQSSVRLWSHSDDMDGKFVAWSRDVIDSDISVNAVHSKLN